jgi:hypothetical protein
MDLEQRFSFDNGMIEAAFLASPLRRALHARIAG